MTSLHIMRALGRHLGRVAYWSDGHHRRIVRRNLAFCFPEWDRQTADRCAREVFQNFGFMALEVLQLAVKGPDGSWLQVRMEGAEHLQGCLQAHGSALLVSAHIGNWEIGPLYAARHLGRPVASVAKPMEWAPFNRWVTAMRTRHGNRIIEKEGALPEMTRTLRQGGLLALLVDQSPRTSEGVEVAFFGHPVTATPAAAMASIRCRVPVVPIFCLREAAGGFRIVVHPPLTGERRGDLRADIRDLTQEVTGVIEKVIREHPAQWFWFHKRWKRAYPWLYYESERRRLRGKIRKIKAVRRQLSSGVGSPPRKN
jgi:KDO2-lipid IV(A) lauroyltransferase